MSLQTIIVTLLMYILRGLYPRNTAEVLQQQAQKPCYGWNASQKKYGGGVSGVSYGPAKVGFSILLMMGSN